MNPNLELAIKTARIDMDARVEHGEFFYPKLIVAYKGPPYVMVMMYDGTFEQLLEALADVAAVAPLESLCLISDSYAADVEGYDKLPPEEVQRYIDAAENHILGELFEAKDPLVSESLAIHFKDETTDDFVQVPYVRQDDGTVLWSDPRLRDSSEIIQGRIQDALGYTLAVSKELDINGVFKKDPAGEQPG